MVSKSDGGIAGSDFAAIRDEAAPATGDDAFGLHFGERSNPENLG